MSRIETIAALEALYDAPAGRSIDKVMQVLTPAYQRWIEASRFVVLSTVGPDGTDASPRGDVGPVATIADEKTLLLPDWRGNNRLDSLRNIVSDGRVSLMFMVVGSTNVVRINGSADLMAGAQACDPFERKGIVPKTVISVRVGEIYFQCAKAIMRAGIWGDAAKADVPSAGDFLKEADGSFDGAEYDAGYGERAKKLMW